MHSHSIGEFQHEHVFLGDDHDRNERKTWIVIGICGATMIAEIGGGAVFGSMALIADGLHMSTHAAALLIAAFAYTYARRHARDERFSFGTGKLGDLAGYTSAIALAMIATLIGYESLSRLVHPVTIAFNRAIPVAILGLCVNILSAWLLKDDHHHDDDHQSHKSADNSHRDLNLRAAYVHVLADAAVSGLAIIGLLAGRQLGWVWMDPIMGLAGACVIANWSWGLVRVAGRVMLDMKPDQATAKSIMERLELGTDRITDLHLWRIGPGHNAAMVSLISDDPQQPGAYKARLAGINGLSHVTVEVERCSGRH